MLYDLTEYGDTLNKHHKKNYWTKEEDLKLQLLVSEEGTSSWVTIAKKLPGRSGKQCRERWYNNLDPSIKTTQWTSEEDAMIIQLHNKLGNKWSQIARNLGSGRPSNSVKNRWHSYLKRKCGSMADSSPGEGEKNDEFCTPPKRRLSEPRIMASPYVYESPLGSARSYSPHISSTPVLQSPVAQSPTQRQEFQFKENYVYQKHQTQQYTTPSPSPSPIPRPLIPPDYPIPEISSPSPNSYHIQNTPTMIDNLSSPNPPVDILSMLSPDTQRVLKQILGQTPNDQQSPYENDNPVTSSPNHSPFKCHNKPPPKLSHKFTGSSRTSRFNNIKPIPFNISDATPSQTASMNAMNDQLNMAHNLHQNVSEQMNQPNDSQPKQAYFPSEWVRRRIKITVKPNQDPKENYSAAPTPPVTLSPIKSFGIIPDHENVPLFYYDNECEESEMWYPMEGTRHTDGW